MISYAQNKNISVKVSTNGQLLNKETIYSILDSKLDRLNVALDGTTQETYQTYRKGGDINKVIDGIKALVAEREKRGVTHPIITLEFLVMKHNEHEVKQFEGLAKELGVDIATVKTVNLYGNKDAAGKFLPENPAYNRYADGELAWKENKATGCSRLYDSMLVNWDGSVALCCYDYNGTVNLGSINKNGIKEIWNGPKFRELRKKSFDENQNPQLCRTCPGGYPNLWVYRKSLKKGVPPSF